MNNAKTWFPEELTKPDYPTIDIKRAMAINPTADWRIAIWRPRGGLGDMLMLTPTFEALKREMPNSYITVITSFSYLNGGLVDILEGNPYIDAVIDSSSADSMQQGKFDILIDEANACIPFEIQKATPPHRIDLFAAQAGVSIFDEKPFYKVKEKERENAREFAHVRNLKFKEHVFLYQPFASSEQRSLTLVKTKSVIAKIREEFPNSYTLIPTHKSDWAGPVDFNFVGCEQLPDYNIRLLAAIIDEVVDLVICPDSSLLHLAAALDQPTVALFGPTPSESRVNRYPKAVGLDFGKICKAWPCWYNPCQFGKICWKMMEEDSIIRAMRQVLNGDYSARKVDRVQPRSEII